LYALLSNAELERHYWEWRSANEQIPQDATQTTTLNVAAGTSITNGHTSWGSSTLTLTNDPQTDIKWPDKLDAAAKRALENARAAGRRFFKAKYDLRYKVLKAYYDYALNAELIRLEQGNQRLLRTIATVADTRCLAGRSGQRDVLKSSNEADVSSNDIAKHPFGTIKARMGATHFLMKTLPRVAAEMALHVLAYNMTRVMNIMGTKPLIAAMRA
jgi:hypothetical protein